MEPMAIGSAPSSPSSPSANPNFLPAFLMGDATPNPTSPEPSRGFNQGITSTPIYPKLFANEAPKQTFTPCKPGPPSQGLFDTIESRRMPASPAINQSLNYSRNLNTTLNQSQKLDTHWVTVFGFPPSVLHLVLEQLSSCGVVIDKKIPNQGNWVHVKFHNLTDVPRALTLNGKFLCNNIMIGVNLFYDSEDKENQSLITSPMRARSLRHSYISPNTTTDSVLPPQNLPQRSTGLVSKAIEYVFGW